MKKRAEKIACGCAKHPCVHDMKKITSVEGKLDKILERIGEAPTPEQIEQQKKMGKAREIIARVADPSGRVTLWNWLAANPKDRGELRKLFNLALIDEEPGIHAEEVDATAFLLALDFGATFEKR